MNTPSDSVPADASAVRRGRRLVMGVAGLAALGGVGLGWRQLSANKAQPSTNSGQYPEFWRSEFDSPDGTKLPLSKFQGKPLLLNFWATWCPPCIEELPLLNNFFAENAAKGWQVLGLAIDKKDPVLGFLKKMPLQFPVGLAAIDGIDLSRSMGNIAGGLPFTVVFDAAGQVVHRKMGVLKAAELSQLRSAYTP